MTEKTCPACGLAKRLEDFYASKSAKDGKQTWCKECQRSRKRNPEVGRRNTRRWQAANPDKHRVHAHVFYALSVGQITRPEKCEECGGRGKPVSDGQSPIQAHHEDYSKPLEVRWLCATCHAQHHRKATNA